LQPKRKGPFSSIESRDDALKLVKDTSSAFFLLALLQAVLAPWLGLFLLLRAVLYAAGGFLVRRFHSRGAAFAMLLLASVGVIAAVSNLFGAKLGGGRNVLLALVLLWAAVRAVEATFKLHGRFAKKSTSEVSEEDR
jgi:hypothetical protein